MWVGDALRLNHYWGETPPVHKLVAAYFGLGKKTKDALSGDDLADMLGASVSVSVPATSDEPTVVVGPPPPTHISKE